MRHHNRHFIEKEIIFMEAKPQKVIILIEDLFNLFEFWYPYYRVQEDGIGVSVVGPQKGKTYTGKPGTEVTADFSADETDPAQYDGIIIPGGYAPDLMRRYPAMVDLVRKMDAEGKPVAAICHAGWMLISAGILQDRKATSFFAIKDDMKNAGALWEDKEVVVERTFKILCQLTES
ncbi:MAG: type 1 glutamine amidotransferase [Desulfobacteraceae bacterium]|nr:MAG: type 1 glutamine amidotransferase [Desulfobacteraceae bacterium]